MKIFAFAASARTGSFNRKLIAQAAEVLRAAPGVEVDLAEFRDLGIPLYDGDLEQASGLPQGVQATIRRLEAADAMVISTPEYNGGIPGTLKNALDWISRATPMPIDGKPLLFLSASPGGFGGVRGLWHTRVPFEAIGGLVYPEMFGLPKANQAFEDSGKFVDPKNRARLEELVSDFLSFAKAIAVSRH